MPRARYDEVADFYEAGWQDDYADPVSQALLDLIGAVDGTRVIDIACGHGRFSRELARRGARVVGIDISRRLIEKAMAAESDHPLGVQYLVADVGHGAGLAESHFDLAVCSFGLSDIDDLDGAIASITRHVRADGRFVFSILHPCFPGAGDVSGSWPPAATYYDEGRWVAAGASSTLRRVVGANHRTLSTYVQTLRRHGWWIDALVEPRPSGEWRGANRQAAGYPLYLVVGCVRRPHEAGTHDLSPVADDVVRRSP